MLIHPPQIEARDGEVRISARIELKGPLAGAPAELWFAVPAAHERQVNDRSDPFLVAMLPVAMALGEDIEVRGRVSPRVAYGAVQYQQVQRAFWPQHTRRISAINAARLEPTTVRGEAVACSFSGGVDSFYTLWRHLPEQEPVAAARVTHALTINGFDKDVDLEGAGHFRRVADLYRPLLARSGVEHLTVRTNQRLFRRPALGDEGLLRTFGAGLTACALIYGDLLGRFYLAGSTSYADLSRDGSHPVLDPLLGTETCEIVHSGMEVTRAEKTALIARWPETWQHLRVCNGVERNIDAEGRVFNCGRCSKCVRTMVTLELVGALDHYTTFRAPLTRQSIRRAPQPSRTHIYTDENLALAARAGRSDIAVDLRWGRARSWLLERGGALRRKLRKLVSDAR